MIYAICRQIIGAVLSVFWYHHAYLVMISESGEDFCGVPPLITVPF